jgi:ribosomal-protein-alanine N-acetyltransferase
VAETDGRIDGHGIMMARAGEAHILNVCVDPRARRSGIASALLDQLLEVAVTAHADCAFLEVRPSNHGAIALYQRAGFHEVGRRPNYYPAPFGREDALVMARGLADRDEDTSQRV